MADTVLASSSRGKAAPTGQHLAGARAVRVWDLPTRLFHWLLVLCVIGSVVTAKVGGNATIWHFRLGYVVLALLVFRLLWGLVGGYWSRFSSFIYSPATLIAYLRGARGPGGRWDVGHSPTGALSVFALLALLMAQVATGLVADDEIANTGPLNRFVSSAVADPATAWHSEWGQWLLLGLIALHVLAIVIYRLRGRNLVAPMLHGDKALPPDAQLPVSADHAGRRWLALLLLGIGAALAALVASFG